MNSRTPMPSEGRFVLLVLAAAIAPVVIKKSKPLAKYVGDRLVNWGERLRTGTEPSHSEPNEAVKRENETTKSDQEAKGVKIDSSSPTGHEEIEQHVIHEQIEEPSEPIAPDPANDDHDKPGAPPDENPKKPDSE